MNLDKLFEVSNRVGKEIPFYTQGAGGNISVKLDDTLYIKASGHRLDRIFSMDGISVLPIRKTAAAISEIQDQSPEAEEKYEQICSAPIKPSMETGMHLFLPQKWVLHFHALSALLMAHEHKKDKNKLQDWFQKTTQLVVTVIEPTRPGLVLSQRIRAERSSSIIILENHGVLLQGDEVSILDRWRELEEAFIRAWGYPTLRRCDKRQQIPFRIYFPDTAVFYDRLMAILTPVDTGSADTLYQVKENARSTDQDAYEIWWATQTLYQACPKLSELPKSISKTLPDLPTEKYRRSKRL